MELAGVATVSKHLTLHEELELGDSQLVQGPVEVRAGRLFTWGSWEHVSKVQWQDPGQCCGRRGPPGPEGGELGRGSSLPRLPCWGLRRVAEPGQGGVVVAGTGRVPGPQRVLHVCSRLVSLQRLHLLTSHTPLLLVTSAAWGKPSYFNTKHTKLGPTPH